ncbi:MAG TPA: type II toxin-antitoxin system VapC family toxin [Thermoanaerobaculia bacterium]|nr:type II toxin-antitoxin system VapC family toxin [Thermoanaerobaculia bacterium]
MVDICYCDSSALIKLFVQEPESDALRGYLAHRPVLVASEFLRVEVLRTVARRGGVAVSARAAAWLRSLALIPVSEPVLTRAVTVKPLEMRALDALHLASALDLSPLPHAFLCYDDRLANAARENGLNVVSPGRDEVHEP